LLSGLQGSGDCFTSNNWGSPEDECIWCWEQGYSDTQGHGSNSSYVFCYYSVMSLQFFSETFTVSSFLYLLPFVSILQSFWRNLISAEQSTHAHIYFGLMIRMASRMGKGALPFCLKPLYSTWITVQFYPWTNHSSARTCPRDRCSYFWTCIIAIIQCCLLANRLVFHFVTSFGYLYMWRTLERMTPDAFSNFRVLLCLKRALRIANAAQQIANATRGCSGPVTLFVEILNKSVAWICNFNLIIHMSHIIWHCMIITGAHASGTCTFLRKETRRLLVLQYKDWSN